MRGSCTNLLSVIAIAATEMEPDDGEGRSPDITLCPLAYAVGRKADMRISNASD